MNPSIGLLRSVLFAAALLIPVAAVAGHGPRTQVLIAPAYFGFSYGTHAYPRFYRYPDRHIVGRHGYYGNRHGLHRHPYRRNYLGQRHYFPRGWHGYPRGYGDRWRAPSHVFPAPRFYRY